MRTKSVTELEREGINSEGDELAANIDREWKPELEKREVPNKRRAFRRLVHPIRLAQAQAGQVAQSQQPRPGAQNEVNGAD